jgi:hypothetical protein
VCSGTISSMPFVGSTNAAGAAAGNESNSNSGSARSAPRIGRDSWTAYLLEGALMRPTV